MHETLGLGTPWPETLRLFVFVLFVFVCFWFFWFFGFFLVLFVFCFFWFFWFFWFFCFSGSFGFVCFLGCCDSDYVVCAVRGDLSASSTVNAHSQGPRFVYICGQREQWNTLNPKKRSKRNNNKLSTTLLPLHVRRQEFTILSCCRFSEP